MLKRFQFIYPCILGAVLAAGFLGTGAPAVAAVAAADPTPNCGGLDQSICKAKKAVYEGKLTNKKPKGAFIDPRKGGEYWKCPSKTKRTVFSVTSKKACEKKFLKFKKAKYLGKVFKKKPKGSFIDPRKGGEYWSCPKAYFRNVTKVTSKSACLPNIDKVCDKGNIDIRGKCLKRKVCGKEGDRPCLIVERIPSCNKGFMEEFITNRCMRPEMFLCTVTSKIIGAAVKGEKKLGKAEKKIEKAVGKAVKVGLKAVLGKKGYKSLTKGFKSVDKEVKKAEKKINKVLKPIKKKIEKNFNTSVIKYVDMVKKNKNAVLKIFSKSDFCSKSGKDKVATMIKAIGFTPSVSIPNSYMTLGIALSISKTPPALKAAGLEVGGGIDIGLYFLTNFKDELATRLSLGVSATTDAGTGVTLTAGVAFGETAADVGGGGFSVGMSLDSGSSNKGAYDVDVLLSGKDFSLAGFEFGFALADKKSKGVSASAGVGWGYDFPLGKTIKF